MGRHSTQRPRAVVPPIGTEPFPMPGDGGEEPKSCADEFVARLRGPDLLADVVGDPVLIQQRPNGDFVAEHAGLGTIGRLVELDARQQRCLDLDPYVGVVVEEAGDGPAVQLSRVASH